MSWSPRQPGAPLMMPATAGFAELGHAQ